MKIAIVYVYPINIDPRAPGFAARFLETYHIFSPGMDHDSIVVLNAGKVTNELRCMFSCLKNLRFIEHDDSGWDIGAFQRAAMENPDYDLMVFFGTSVYLKAQGWLIRMATAAKNHGTALYGTMGNGGVAAFKVYPHVRTTGFFLSPRLMNEYPNRVTRADQRYEFEHGKTCLAEWIRKKGLRTWVVTRFKEYPQNEWDSIPNGYHRGDQSAMLCGDRLTEPPYYHIP